MGSVLKKLDKKVYILIFAIILILVIAFFIIKNINRKEISEEERLSNLLIKMSSEFYENFYYDQIGSTEEDRINFVKKYETIGIKFNLDNLSRYNFDENNELIKEFINSNTNLECNRVNTKAIIYPVEPYSKKSYNIKIELDCSFDNNK